MPELPSLDLPAPPRPTADRPLQGLTILVVEDSRFASEAVRLMCLRSGARLRRADSLTAAQRHLKTYRPTAIIVDLGLPDGSGLDLIDVLAKAEPRIPAILAMSGDEAQLGRALLMGADAALAKPLAELSLFQETLLGCLPAGYRPSGPRQLACETVMPDELALHDDMARMAEMMAASGPEVSMDYVAQFLSGLGRAAGDRALEDAAALLHHRCEQGAPVLGDMARIAGMLQERLAHRRAV